MYRGIMADSGVSDTLSYSLCRSSLWKLIKSVFILCSVLSLQGCEGGILFYDSGTGEGEDEGTWGPPIPFLGPTFAQRLMGARQVRDWERASQIKGSNKNNQNSDDGFFRMGDEVFSIKQSNLQLSWTRRDGDIGGEGAATRDSLSPSALQLHDRWWPEWQLPVLLAVFALVGGLGLSVVILVWLKNQMSSSSPTNEKEELPAEVTTASSGGHSEGSQQWIYHPVIRPMTTETPVPAATAPVSTTQPQSACHSILPEVMTVKQGEGEERRPEPIRIKAKGLLERRGSSASLTIDLPHPSQENLTVAPTRECTAEEYLLSVGNVLSRKQLRACLRDVRSLHREFWDLPLNHPEKLIVPGSGSKNRYRTIIPNEATRVHLPPGTAADSLTGYINANYIKGYDGEEKAFIATQGPLQHTVVDFWVMIWEEHAPVIVMFTKLWEKSHSKCEPYFPAELNTSAVHGDMTVTVKSVHVKDGYTVRQFEIRKGEECRHTVHFWFDSWPDHKTPANAHSLLCLAKEVEIARFLGPSQRRNSPSVWSTGKAGNESPSPFQKERKSQFLTPHSAEISPNQESDVSPPSLKEASPVLNFGRLEFNDDTDVDIETTHFCQKETEIEMKMDVGNKEPIDSKILSLLSSQEELKRPSEEPIIKPDTSESRRTEKNENILGVSGPFCSDASKIRRQSSLEIKQHPRFFDFYGHSGVKKPYKFGSLPHDSPMYPHLDLDNIRSKSVEAPPTWIEPTKDFNLSQVQKDKCEALPDTFFDFGNLTLSQCQEPAEIGGESAKSEESGTVDEVKHQLSPQCAGASGGRATRLSVDSPGFSPFFSEAIPWLQSRGWLGSTGGDNSPSASPSWTDQCATPKGREGSLSGLLWGDVPRGTSAGPVVVHCSAGIGRTGCFIAICIGINQLLGENNVDILGIVCRMRYDRGGMVQTAEQYEFIHRALALFERSLPDQSGE